MKSLYIVFLIVLGGCSATVSICRPDIITKNVFIEEFVVHDTLNIMAVIMTIAIATIATIHIWFNELEHKHDRKVFGAARREINQDAFALIWLFIFELIVTIGRAYFMKGTTSLALFDSGAIFIFLVSVVTLIDILNVVRALTPSD